MDLNLGRNELNLDLGLVDPSGQVVEMEEDDGMKCEDEHSWDNHEVFIGGEEEVYTTEQQHQPQVTYVDDTLQDMVIVPSLPSETTYDPATSAEQVDAQSTEAHSTTGLGTGI